MASRTSRMWWAVVVAIVALNYYFFVSHQSTATLLFLQTVTGTRRVPIREFVFEDPIGMGMNATWALRAVLSAQEMKDVRDAYRAVAESRAAGVERDPADADTASTDADVTGARLHKRGKATFDPTDELQPQQRVVDPPTAATGPGSSTPMQQPVPFSTKRYNSKLHMINQLQLIFDYPLAYIMCNKWRLADVPFISANLISLCHPIVALFAGILFSRAVRRQHSQSDVTATADKTMASVASTPQGQAVAVSSSCNSQQQQQCEELSGFAQSPDKLLAKQSSILLASATNLQNGVVASSAADMMSLIEAEHSSGCALDDDLGGHAKEVELPWKSVRVSYLRLACLLFFVRNFLDALDGVMARTHRQRRATAAGQTVIEPTTFGFNGHSVDVVTDFLGGFMVCLGILFYMFHRQPMIAPFPYQLLMKVGVLRRHATRGVTLSKCVAFAGLLLPAVVGGVWEIFMVRYSNLFDVHANSNEAIFQLESLFVIRLNQFLWSYTCADTMFLVFIVALLLDFIWAALQIYAFVGYVWLLLLSAYSFYIWNFIVWRDPVAQQILLQPA